MDVFAGYTLCITDAIVHDSTLRYKINSSSFNNTLV